MTLATKLAGRVLPWGWTDTVLRQRARSVLFRSGLSDHLALSGLMLEVGAGTGHLAEAVMRRMPARRCVVADPAVPPPQALRVRLARRDFHAVRASAAALPFPDGRFDAAWASFAALDAAALVELRRVVRTGGVLVLIERDGSAWGTMLAHAGWRIRLDIAFKRPFPYLTAGSCRTFVTA